MEQLAELGQLAELAQLAEFRPATTLGYGPLDLRVIQ
jgi:hypothetical protein